MLGELSMGEQLTCNLVFTTSMGVVSHAAADALVNVFIKPKSTEEVSMPALSPASLPFPRNVNIRPLKGIQTN